MSMNYLDQFQQHIAHHNYPSFLSLWEEYCLGDEVDGEELKHILKSVKDSDLAQPFGRHVESGLILWEQIESTELGHEIFKLIIDLQTKNDPNLGKQTLSYLKARYPDDPYYFDKIRLVGLRDGENFQGAVSNYELLTHMKKGNFVFHTSGWGVGEIIDISFVREQFSLEFDYVSGRKDLSFQNAFKTLLPLSNDHFLSLRFGNPDELEKRARKNPIDVIHLLLKNLGNLTAAEMKEELYELVIPADEWVRWWQTARAKIKKDTMIETPSDTRKPFRLRTSEVTHEARLQKALEEKPNAETLIQMVYAFLRDFPGTLKNETFRMTLEEKLKEALSTEELTDAQNLQIHFFLQDLATEKENVTITELVENFTAPEEVIKAIEVVAFKKKALVEMRKYREDWPKIFVDLLLGIEQNPLRDYALAELLKIKKEAEIIKKIEELLSEPNRYPNALIWYFQKVMKNDTLPFSNQEGKNRLFESLLILLGSLEQSAKHRDLIKKVHNFLITGRYANVRKIFQKASKATVQEFLLLATKCQSLNDHDIKILHSLAEVVHPSLKKLSKKYDKQEEGEEPPIWTTDVGYQEIKERIHTISTVETVKVAKEIEEARAHGDLRENAEFKAALERRDRLQSELKMLSDQFSRACILSKQDVETDSVNVGVIIDCIAENGETTSYTLLGPWDSNPEQNILSFQSKLAQSLMGKKIGDTFTIQGKTLKIKNLRNYFDTI